MKTSFEAMGDKVTSNERFQRTCQSYAHSGGSSGAIARAALLAVDAAEVLDSLKELLVVIDDEIEQRQTGGNDENWVELQALSDKAHAAVRKATV